MEVLLKEVFEDDFWIMPQTPQYLEAGVPYITSKNIKKGKIDFSNVNYISEEDYQVISKNRPIKEDDILISMIGTLGETAVVKLEDGKFYGQNMFLVRLDKEKVYDRYFLNYFNSNKVKRDLERSQNQSTQRYLKANHIEDLIIPLPSLGEQRFIAQILDSLSDIIKNRQKELEELDNLIKSRFVEMFGDPVQNEKQWKTKRLLDMGTCKNGMNFHYNDSGVELNCLGVGDFKDLSIIDDTSILPMVSLNEMPTDEYLLQDEDIVFVRSNGNKDLVGRSLVVYPGGTPTTFSGFCIRYRKTDDIVSVPYLLRVLKSDSIRKKMAGRGANIQNLNQQILGTLVIPVPPMDLQNQFADFVASVDKLKFEVQKSLDETQTLMDSLMQQYFG